MLSPDLQPGKVPPPSQNGVELGSSDGWTPQSWRKRPAIAQEIEYKEPLALEEVLRTVASLPPLVSPVKIELARKHFAAAARGEAFIIQGGDCAESFQDVRPLIVQQKVQLLHEQSRLLRDSLGLPVITVGRIAGQYAKPRSCPFETLADGSQVYSFRGENVHGFHPDDRTPDPSRLLQAYFHAGDIGSDESLPATADAPVRRCHRVAGKGPLPHESPGGAGTRAHLHIA